MWAFSGLAHGADALRRWHQYRDRSGRACTRRRLHTALANAADAIDATLYEKLDLNFMRDIARVAGVTSIPLRSRYWCQRLSASAPWASPENAHIA